MNLRYQYKVRSLHLNRPLTSFKILNDDDSRFKWYGNFLEDSTSLRTFVLKICENSGVNPVAGLYPCNICEGNDRRYNIAGYLESEVFPMSIRYKKVWFSGDLVPSNYDRIIICLPYIRKIDHNVDCDNYDMSGYFSTLHDNWKIWSSHHLWFMTGDYRVDNVGDTPSYILSNFVTVYHEGVKPDLIDTIYINRLHNYPHSTLKMRYIECKEGDEGDTGSFGEIDVPEDYDDFKNHWCNTLNSWCEHRFNAIRETERADKKRMSRYNVVREFDEELRCVIKNYSKDLEVYGLKFTYEPLKKHFFYAHTKIKRVMCGRTGESHKLTEVEKAEIDKWKKWYRGFEIRYIERLRVHLGIRNLTHTELVNTINKSKMSKFSDSVVCKMDIGYVGLFMMQMDGNHMSLSMWLNSYDINEDYDHNIHNKVYLTKEMENKDENVLPGIYRGMYDHSSPTITNVDEVRMDVVSRFVHIMDSPKKLPEDYNLLRVKLATLCKFEDFVKLNADIHSKRNNMEVSSHMLDLFTIPMTCSRVCEEKPFDFVHSFTHADLTLMKQSYVSGDHSKCPTFGTSKVTDQMTWCGLIVCDLHSYIRNHLPNIYGNHPVYYIKTLRKQGRFGYIRMSRKDFNTDHDHFYYKHVWEIDPNILKLTYTLGEQLSCMCFRLISQYLQNQYSGNRVFMYANNAYDSNLDTLISSLTTILNRKKFTRILRDVIVKRCKYQYDWNDVFEVNELPVHIYHNTENEDDIRFANSDEVYHKTMLKGMVEIDKATLKQFCSQYLQS